tara:strand:+ start:2155 stop:2304 length:150 start_codon:yes stop_codon:yes gene_type:complete
MGAELFKNGSWRLNSDKIRLGKFSECLKLFRLNERSLDLKSANYAKNLS